MQHHRLGYPEVQAAVDQILDPADCASARQLTSEWRAYKVESASERFRTMPKGHSKAADAAATAQWERKNPIAAPAARMQDQPYQPEGFDFAYVDCKGHQGAVIPMRKRAQPVEATAVVYVSADSFKGAPAGSTISVSLSGGEWRPVGTVLAPLTRPVEAPTEWQDGPPPENGWWSVQQVTGWNEDCGHAAYWNGERYTQFKSGGDKPAMDLVSMYPTGYGTWVKAASSDQKECAQWRGPRLSGADWPEPAQAEEVPSIQAVMEAIYSANARMGVGYVALMHTQMCGSIEYKKTPANMRAEFIRRCNELR